VALSETCSSEGEGGARGEGISEMSFLQVGQRLVQEGGYDFLSDFGSDGHSPTEKSTSPKRVRQVMLERSVEEQKKASSDVHECICCCGACSHNPCADSVADVQSKAEINLLTLSAYSDCGVPFAQRSSTDEADE